MANENKKCAHPACACVVTPGQKYCSPFCETAGGKETEIACGCGHPACSK